MNIKRHRKESTWLDARRSKVQASEAAQVLGCSTYGDSLSVYADKTSPEDTRSEPTMAQKMGHKLEPVVAELYEEQTGWKTEDLGDFAIVTHPVNDWQGCTPDRIIHSNSDDGVLEIKTHSSFRTEDWDDGPPLPYQVQVQHQLACCDLSWGAIAVLIGTQDFRIFTVERDDRFITAMTEAERRFWFEHVQKNVPPPAVDGSAATRQALARLHPQDDGSLVRADGLPATMGDEHTDALECVLAYDTDTFSGVLGGLKDIRKWCDARIKERENALIAVMGSSTYAQLPDGSCYSLKSQTRKAYQVEEKTFRVLWSVKKLPPNLLENTDDTQRISHTDSDAVTAGHAGAA